VSTLTIAVDSAKNVFEIAVANHAGTIVDRKRLSRAQFARVCALQPKCRVVMEACASAHFLARCLRRRGFEAAMLPPAYVRPYRRRGKTDRTDCEAILEAIAVLAFTRSASRVTTSKRLWRCTGSAPNG
jgi:transposase